MPHIKVGRRDFVRTVGVSAAALPLLRAAHAAADGHEMPKRFMVMFSPNGTIQDEWAPAGGRTDFTFRRILEPLEEFKSNIIVLDGVDMESTNHGPGDGHQKGMGHMLTGVELLDGDVKGGCDSCPPAGLAGGISIDQHIANHIGADSRFRSLELGLRCGGGANAWTRMSYRGADEANPPEEDPYAAFDRVFGSLSSEDLEAAQRRRALRQSVLDFIQHDFTRLESRLGKDAQSKLESHLEGIRAIERRLESAGELGGACESPDMGARLDLNQIDNYPTLSRLHLDILAMSFACDLTRVGSMQYTKSVGNITLPWLGIGDRHHSLSHDANSSSTARERLIQINRWYAGELAYFLGRLASIPEGDGTMLDNTVVLWCNELGDGDRHSRDRIPWVVAGSGGGAVSTGQYLQFDGRPHNDLLLTLAQAMGREDTSFGDPRFNTGPITDMLT